MKTVTLALALLAALAPAQLRAQGDDAVGEDEAVVGRSAAMLEKEAEALSADQGSFAEAAALYRKAAVLRGDDDLRSVENLRKAGRLAYYIRDYSLSIDDLERAGEIAREGGWSTEALNSFYDAAWVAHKGGRTVTATRMLRRVVVLCRDPDFVNAATPEVLARIMRMRATAG